MRSIRRLVFAGAVAAVAAMPAAAQELPRFTVEEMLKLDRVSDPQLSPDARHVAYVVTAVSLERNARDGDIWMVPVQGGKPVAIARSEKSDDTPRWSPDGRTLAFVSTRDGSSQVWLVAMGPAGPAGEPRKLTALATEASGVAWSPDGKWILFASDVYPECGTLACNEQKLKESEARKSRARVIDGLMFRHWTSWKEGRFSHLFLVPADGSAAPRDVTPGRADVPPFSLGGPADYAFSPDSRELAFVRKTDKVEATSTNSDLFLLDLTDPNAEARKITANPAADGGPAYSPDGRFIAYRAQRRAGFEADRWQLTLYDRKAGEHRSATAGWDRSPDGYVWAPDSEAIFLTAENGGRSEVFRLDLGGGDPRPVVTGGTSGDLQISRDGRTIVYSRNTLTFPSELFALDLGAAGQQAGSARQLTHANPGLAAFKLRDGESVRYTGAGGAEIQAWIVKPPGFQEGRKYPLLYLVHGGPQGAWHDGWTFRWNAQVFAAAGYVVMMPNPRGSTGFGQTFVDEISGDWGGKVYDDLMRGVDFAEALPYVEKGRAGAAGASFGGYMMNWFLGHTTRFKAIVTHAGVYNLTSMWGVTEELWFPEWDIQGTPWTNPEGYTTFSPHTYAKGFQTPTLVTHGEIDFRVPIGEALQLFTTLQRLEVPSRLVSFPDEGHWINKPANSALWYREFIAWMDRWVKNDGKQ
ncbi:MAG: peptidase prolyl oligopeptidase active site domain protein [Acidobacteria bacterium]|nr:peptidase prolyl oligopeptidase active site domain protein [Acidobacteriota bacterium]